MSNETKKKHLPSHPANPKNVQVTQAEFDKALELSAKPEDREASRVYLNKLAEKYKMGPHPDGDWGLDEDRYLR